MFNGRLDNNILVNNSGLMDGLQNGMFDNYYSNKRDIIKNGLIMHLDSSNRISSIDGSNSWIDLSNSKNNATHYGSSFNNLNKGSIYYDGNSAYSEISNNSSLNPVEVTVNVWFKCISTVGGISAGAQIVGKADTNGSQNGWIILANATTIYITLKDAVNNYTFSLKSVNTRDWINVSFTYNTNTAKGYHNGCIIQERTISQINISSNPLKFAISSDSFYGRFNGFIANFQYYNRALSEEEILYNYDALKSRFGL